LAVSVLPSYLHSFLTRRSSDLFHRNRQLCGPAMRFIVQHNRTLQTAFQVRDATRENVEIDPHAVRTDLELFIIALARRIGLQERSEEHTSELQSRVDIVCRLLL